MKPARRGTFLCGCIPAEKRNYSGDVVTTVSGDRVYQDKRYDSGGHEVCPEHGERFYGWRDDDMTMPNYVERGNGRPPLFIAPKMPALKSRSEVEDRRDNRDPEEVYAAMKSGSNGFHGVGDN